VLQFSFRLNEKRIKGVMNKFCTTCGNEVYETFRICPRCGNQSFSIDPIAKPALTKPLQQSSANLNIVGNTSSTQFVSAGNWARFFAYIVDLVCFILIAMLISVLLGFSIAISISSVSDLTLKAIGQLTGWIVLVLYFALFHSSKLQATPGKLAAGLKIITIDGKKVSPGKALVRSLLSVGIMLLGIIVIVLISLVFSVEKNNHSYFYPLLAIFCGYMVWNAPYLMLFFNDERQTLFDSICKTRVVKR
jgi:uncharacterized RDD family membrane protein YckC/ribosomal protein S27AE